MTDGDTLPATIEATDTALAEIAPDGSRAYWKDEGRQSRYRDLLTHKEKLEAAREPAPAAENPLAIPSREEFTRQYPGGDYGALVGVARHVPDILLRVPEDEQGSFIASFEALPDSLTAHMVGELMNRSWAATDPMPEAEFQAFAQGQGRAIVAEWGHEAQSKAARVRGRLWRLIDGLASDRDAERFADWLADLSPAAAAAVYRKLGG